MVIANPETKGMCADSHLGEVCHVSKLEDCELCIIDFCLKFDGPKFCVRFGFTISSRYPLIEFKCLQIWVNSPHNGSGYFMTGEDSQTEDRFNARLTTGPSGDMGVQYARTGCLGFIKRTDFTQTDGGRFTRVKFAL